MTIIPLQSVVFRAGAVPNRDMVTVLAESATKIDTKDEPVNAGSGQDLETMLSVRALVRRPGDVEHIWVDVHVFDGQDEPIKSETLALHHVQATDDGDEYRYDGSVFRGTGASPGSVWLAPDARKVQYRLYCEADGTVFSDGLLRQHEVPADSNIINPGVAAPPHGYQAAQRTPLPVT